jgi:hypothetical protein
VRPTALVWLGGGSPLWSLRSGDVRVCAVLRCSRPAGDPRGHSGWYFAGRALGGEHQPFTDHGRCPACCCRCRVPHCVPASLSKASIESFQPLDVAMLGDCFSPAAATSCDWAAALGPDGVGCGLMNVRCACVPGGLEEGKVRECGRAHRRAQGVAGGWRRGGTGRAQIVGLRVGTARSALAQALTRLSHVCMRPGQRFVG